MTKRLISTAILLAAAATAPAQLVSLDYNTGTGNWEYGSFDPNGGAITTLNTFQLPDGYDEGSFLTDPSTGSAYLQSGSSLYEFNLASGAVLGSPTLDTQMFDYGVGYNGLVGLDYNSGTGNWEYRTINPVTGSTTLLNTFTVSSGLEDSSFLTDPSANSAYVISGNNSLYWINLVSGGVINIATPSSLIYGYGLGNGSLVALTYDSGTGNFEYGTLDPSSGAINVLNSFALPGGYTGGTFMTDYATDSAYFLSGNTLYDLNLGTGAIESTTTPDVQLQAVGIDPVPEPSTLALAALGGMVTLLRLRKKMV